MSSQDPTIFAIIDDGVATITLNQPESKNSMVVLLFNLNPKHSNLVMFSFFQGAELINSLGDNLKACYSKDSVRAIVLTNVGNTFCAGANLKRQGNLWNYPLSQINPN